MRKRLWSRSIPFPLRSDVTSVNELVRSLMEYFEELLRYAVRVTINCDLGTRRKLSTPGYTPSLVTYPLRRDDPGTSVGTYQVDNLPEPDFNRAALQSLLAGRVMDQLAQLPLSHLARSISEYKQESVDGIALPASVWSDDSGEGFMERSDLLSSCIGFEIDEHKFVNGESGFRAGRRECSSRNGCG